MNGLAMGFCREKARSQKLQWVERQRQRAHACAQGYTDKAPGTVAMPLACLCAPCLAHLLHVGLSASDQEPHVCSERVQKWNRFGEISSKCAYISGTSEIESSKHTGQSPST